MVLIVGLGNPTKRYENNRHNVGFMVIDKLVDNHKAIDISKSSFKGSLFKSKNLLFLKPNRYMNLSGESVWAVYSYYKPDKLIVIHDELDLEFGHIRFKRGGGCGGHNGLKSIDSYIGNDYYRVRIGISKPIKKDDITKHVLGDFFKEQLECLRVVIDNSCEIVIALSQFDIKEVQQRYSSKKSYCK